MTQTRSRSTKPRTTQQEAEPKTSLARLSKLCLAFPGTEESVSWGNPTFKANRKAFAVLDRYKSEECIWFRCPKSARAELLAQDGFFEAPYNKAKAALCRKTSRISWTEMRKLLRASYEAALLK
jgi:predicted DNA-binding protein (MmcQ/YjbR family)